MAKKLSIAYIIISALMLITLTGGCGKRKPALTPVTINQAFEHLLYIGLYVAKDAGFFEQQGLDVKIETGGGDAQAFSALTSGSAQFAQGDPAFVAIANEKGWEGRVVARLIESPYGESPLTSPLSLSLILRASKVKPLPPIQSRIPRMLYRSSLP